MNQRVFDMARQSGATDEKGSRAEHVFCFTKDELKGFAELIVRECEKVAKDPQWYGESPSYGWRNPIRHVCNVMKQHFGVKE